MVAIELQCSMSERSSLEVALEQVSRPLSVAVGLEIDEPPLSEAGRPQVEIPCSMNRTPPNLTDKFKQNDDGFDKGSLMILSVLLSPERLLLLRVLD